MRIAIVHSYYSSRHPSGENIAVDTQAQLLREAGHEVLLVTQRTDDREGSRLYPVEAAVTVTTGHGRSPLPALRDFGPEIVHVHNLFPNWGTAWLARWDGPLVATLHNFRPLCAAGTLYRAGKTCTLCPDGNVWAGLKHRCYRHSWAATAPIAWSGRRGPSGSALLQRADVLVTLAERARNLYASFGVDTERLVVIPNFLPDPYPRGLPSGKSNGRWVYVGRLAPEKGIDELVRNWPRGRPLDVIGDGPLRERIAASTPPHIRLLGTRPRDELLASLPTYDGLVFPSRWPEGLPTSLLEAMAAGLPVAALRGSSAGDVVAATGSGVVIERSSDWGAGLASLLAHRATYSHAARTAFISDHSPTTWLERIEARYVRLTVRGGTR
jgi:glycosyltransferase involved in cell wall biosynthesis